MKIIALYLMRKNTWIHNFVKGYSIEWAPDYSVTRYKEIKKDFPEIYFMKTIIKENYLVLFTRFKNTDKGCSHKVQLHHLSADYLDIWPETYIGNLR